MKKFFLLLLFFLTIIFCCYPGLFVCFSSAVIRGDMGDLKNILSIISYSIHAPIKEIYQLPIFYPETFMLTKTHPLFGISIFFKGFDWLGLSLTESVNLYTILSLLLGAWGTYLLSKEFVEEKKHWIALFFSVLYILHPLNHLHFVWLNFLSRFYIPFIFLFLVKYFKTGKKKFAVSTAILALMQFLACTYYGVLLWVFMLPLTVGLALLLKRIRFKQLWFLAGCLVVAFLFILLIYYPYVTENPSTVKHFDGKLVQVEELFSVSKLLSLFWGEPGNISQYFFPGFLFSAAILLFWVSFQEKRRLLLGILLLVLLLSMSLGVYIHHNALNILFLLFSILLVFLTVKGWKAMNDWERLVVLVTMLSSFTLFHFTFPSFMKSLAPYRWLYALLPAGGLTVTKRSFLIFLPFFALLATIGTARLLPTSWFTFSDEEEKPSKNHFRLRKKALYFSILFVGLLSVMMLENIRNPFLYLKDTTPDQTNENRVMKSFPEAPEVYHHLPFEKKQVVLELPFYFRRRLKNVDYMFNQRFHRNYLMNGKISIFPEAYYQKLSGIIGKFQLDFPNEQAIKELIKEYGTDYIIIHWNALKEYQGIHRKPVSKAMILQRIEILKDYLQIIYMGDHNMLLKLKKPL